MQGGSWLPPHVRLLPRSYGQGAIGISLQLVRQVVNRKTWTVKRGFPVAALGVEISEALPRFTICLFRPVLMPGRARKLQPTVLRQFGDATWYPYFTDPEVWRYLRKWSSEYFHARYHVPGVLEVDLRTPWKVAEGE